MTKHYEPAKPGTKLAGYNVLAEIGRGAASIIYLVQDSKNKQIYALKHVEKHEPKDQRFLDQAIKEYEIGSKVKHPAVRSIEKLIKTRERLVSLKEVFLLMEYVDGVSVEKTPPTDMADSLVIFKETAAGLAAMHEAGFVHADMKPNNIVINEHHHVKVIDLGQACKSGTVKERIQGTPDYIAPEQVALQEITPQTDIYNLGATMYWVLTKTHIPTAMSSESDSLMSGIDKGLVERASAPSKLNPAIPEKLDELILECVEPDPDDRPVTMAEVRDRLDLIHAMVVAANDPKPAAIDDD